MRALTKNEVQTLMTLNSVASLSLFIVTKRRYGWKGVGILWLVQTQSDLGTFLALHKIGAIKWKAIRTSWRETGQSLRDARESIKAARGAR